MAGGGGGQQVEGGPKKARIEIIPLIDVIFFLLATFVLFTLSLNKIASLDLNLPKGGDTTSEDPNILYIQTSGPDTFYWKRGSTSTPEIISTAEIPARLESYKNEVAVPRVL